MLVIDGTSLMIFNYKLKVALKVLAKCVEERERVCVCVCECGIERERERDSSER
jgi:hypothetical protein